jgi:hypothetical protein
MRESSSQAVILPSSSTPGPKGEPEVLSWPPRKLQKVSARMPIILAFVMKEKTVMYVFLFGSLCQSFVSFALGAIGSVQEGGQYKNTVDLPQTSFNMKANAVQREPEIQKLWEDKQILQKLLERNTGV